MTKPINNLIDFSTILASSVHDIKNSLATMRELISQVADTQESKKSSEFIQLEFEANRMNNSLIQLLELYKIDSEKFTLNIDEYLTDDILNEVKAQQAPLLQLNNISLSIDCPEDLYCYCDYALICIALSSLLNNAQRYTQAKIHLSAYQEQDYLVFSIEDDGAGYPEQILAIDPVNSQQRDWITGSTGLGLHFVSTIATLHTSKKHQGMIKFDNNSGLGGARFRLFLP